MKDLMKIFAECNWDLSKCKTALLDVVEDWNKNSENLSLREYMNLSTNQYQTFLTFDSEVLISEFYAKWIQDHSYKLVKKTDEGYLISSTINADINQIAYICDTCKDDIHESTKKFYEMKLCNSPEVFFGGQRWKTQGNYILMNSFGSVRIPELFGCQVSDESNLISKILNKHPEAKDFWIFPQVWGSTALGYSGIGGSAMTRGTSVVVQEPFMEDLDFFCYLGYDVPAYIIRNPNEKFFEDLHKFSLLPEYAVQDTPDVYGLVVPLNSTEYNPNTYCLQFTTDSGEVYSTSLLDSNEYKLSDVLMLFTGVDSIETFLAKCEDLFKDTSAKGGKLKDIPDIDKCGSIFVVGSGFPKLY